MCPQEPLSPQEKKQAEELAAARAHIIHEVVRREGAEEVERSVMSLAWSGLAAGLSMGFSLVAQGLLSAHLPAGNWNTLISNLGYSVGFVIVILGKQELYTEKTLTPVVPFLSRPSRDSFVRLLRLWGIVLFTNLVGALAVAWACSQSGIFSPEVRHAFVEIGDRAMGAHFGHTLFRAIFAGWLIALIPWILGGMSGGEFMIIYLLTYFVGLGRFSHIIAGSVETLYLVVTGAATWGDYFGHFMIPTLIGNTIGGVALVALVNHAQVASGRKR